MPIVPSGGILAADSISRALGDLMKGMFGVEQATPEIQAQALKQGQSQRQEDLGIAKLPMDIAQQQAQIAHLGAQTENLGSQSEWHRAQAEGMPSTIGLRTARSLAQLGAYSEHNAKVQKLADDLERKNKYEAAVQALDPNAPDYGRQLGAVLAEHHPTAAAVREVVKPPDPLLEEKRKALVSLQAQRDSMAKYHDPNNPFHQKRLEYYDSRIALLKAQTAAAGAKAAGSGLTSYQEKQMVARLGGQATAQVQMAMQSEVGKDFSSLGETPMERINSINWLRQYILNNLLFMQGPDMHKYIDKEIDPKKPPKGLKALMDKSGGKKWLDFGWLKGALGTAAGASVGGLPGANWGTGQKTPSVTLPELAPKGGDVEDEGDELGSGDENDDPLGLFKGK